MLFEGQPSKILLHLHQVAAAVPIEGVQVQALAALHSADTYLALIHLHLLTPVRTDPLPRGDEIKVLMQGAVSLYQSVRL